MEVANDELESIHTDVRAFRNNLGLPNSPDVSTSNATTCNLGVSTTMKNNICLSHSSQSLPPSPRSIKDETVSKDEFFIFEGTKDRAGDNIDIYSNIDNNISTSNSKNCNRSSDQDRISSNNFDENQFSSELEMAMDGFDFNFFTPPILLLVDELARLERDLDQLSVLTGTQRYVQVPILFCFLVCCSCFESVHYCFACFNRYRIKHVLKYSSI